MATMIELLTALTLGSKEQKEKRYLKFSPNGEIAIIVDRHDDDFVIRPFAEKW